MLAVCCSFLLFRSALSGRSSVLVLVSLRSSFVLPFWFGCSLRSVAHSSHSFSLDCVHYAMFVLSAYRLRDAICGAMRSMFCELRVHSQVSEHDCVVFVLYINPAV